MTHKSNTNAKCHGIEHWFLFGQNFIKILINISSMALVFIFIGS